jgi:zinc transport system substrate-binding protein
MLLRGVLKMRTTRIAVFALTLWLPSFARADTPQVIADIAPVHSLVAQIMDGVGTPELLLPATASPHDYALRPSDARRLQNADAVFWVGDALTPWLKATLETLAADAERVSLLEAEGTLMLEFREGAVFAEEPSDGTDAHDHDRHSHLGTDPHAWLDPLNARVWLSAIAAELSRIDPDNAAIYQSNMVESQKQMDLLLDQLNQDLEPARAARFVVLHDGYRYFEDRFGVRALGAISQSDAAAPSAARVKDIRQAMEDAEVSCLFTEIQLNSPLLTSIASETDVKVVALDPLGGQLVPGGELYDKLMENMVKSFLSCL